MQQTSNTSSTVPPSAQTQTAVVKPPLQSLAPAASSQNLCDQFAARINEAYRCAIGWALLTGRELLRAKAALRGEWVTLFSTQKVKFGLRVAEMYMSIAQHPFINSERNLVYLPSSYTTLYVLTNLSVSALQAKTAAGEITPATTLAQARRIVAQACAGPNVAPVGTLPRAFDVTHSKKRIESYLRHQLEQWPGAEREELASLLEQIASELRRKAAHPMEVTR